MNWLSRGRTYLRAVVKTSGVFTPAKQQEIRLPSPQRGRGAGGEGACYAAIGCLHLLIQQASSALCGAMATACNAPSPPSPSSRVGARGGEILVLFAASGDCSEEMLAKYLADVSHATFRFCLLAQSSQCFRLPRKNCHRLLKSKIDFVRDVEPILHTKCYECHGSGMQMNGLRFDQKEAALKGGYSGPAIVAGSSAKSPLILRVTSDKDGFKMPPAGPSLTAREIGVLRAWIDQGAVWPDVPAAPAGQKLSQAERRSHWSFQPVQRPG